MSFAEVYKKLQEACNTNDLYAFNLYINQFPDLEYKNEKGWTLLIMAAFAHSYEIVDRLIELGADVNAANNKGTTVLMYAKTKVKENNNYDFLDYLISKGADVAAKDAYGKNVYDYVVQTNDIRLAEYFKGKLTTPAYGTE